MPSAKVQGKCTEEKETGSRLDRFDLIGLCTSLANRQLIGSFKPKPSFWPQ